MAPTLLLIDALNVIRRIHAAIPSKPGARDTFVQDDEQVDGALSSTIVSVQRAIQECNPTHALVIFDGDPPTWRHKLLPAYKANRKPMPKALHKRLTDFNKAFRQLGLITFRRNGIEADDVIGTITNKAIIANINTIILSTDKAYRQLLYSSLVTQRDHFQKMNYNQQSTIKEFDIGPEQLLDYWGMAGIGDIPGVDGVGKKGATELIKHFGSLRQVLNEGGKEIEPKGALKKVLNQKEKAEIAV
ncbi:MAG: 5'-3' exonuclease H3TH domain-containing protein, partial [Endozoicomonas sp.]